MLKVTMWLTTTNLSMEDVQSLVERIRMKMEELSNPEREDAGIQAVNQVGYERIGGV